MKTTLTSRRPAFRPTYRNNIRLQPRQLQRPMRPLVARPQFHAPKRPRRRRRARNFIRFDLLDLHTQFDARDYRFATLRTTPLSVQPDAMMLNL